MRRLVSTVIAVALLLALGALAVMALPNGSAPMTASSVAAAPLAAEPDAPAAPTANKVNVISVPLDATDQFAALGQAFDAKGLAAVTGSGVVQIMTWNAPVSSYRTYIPGDEESDNFALTVGGVYRLVLSSGASSIVSFVGDVPAQGSVVFTLVRPAGAGCKVNDISVPLDRADLTDASKLATSIGNVAQVLEWNASVQSYRTYIPGDEESDNFVVKIGYPYRVCLLTGGATQWH